MLDDILNKIITDPTFMKVGVILSILIVLTLFKKLFKIVLTFIVLALLAAIWFLFTNNNPTDKVKEIIKSSNAKVSTFKNKAFEISGEIENLHGLIP